MFSKRTFIKMEDMETQFKDNVIVLISGTGNILGCDFYTYENSRQGAVTLLDMFIVITSLVAKHFICKSYDLRNVCLFRCQRGITVAHRYV